MVVRHVEWELPYTWWIAIEVTANKVINLLLRQEDNLLHVNDDNELYCDLQLENGIAPTDDFPVWITTWIVNASDGRSQNWLLLHYETTSWAYAQWLYWADGKLYFDGWTWTWKQVYFADEVDALIQNLANSISAVWYSGEYSDLLHRPWIVHISYSEELNEWIMNWTMIDNCTVMITPFNWQVPATIVIDGTTYTLQWNNWNTFYVYGNEPLVCLYQPDGNTHYLNTFQRAYDTSISDTSRNAVENRVIKWELDLKANISDLPNVWEWVLTIQKNGTTVASFWANATSNVTANIGVPTATSELTNNSGFIDNTVNDLVNYTTTANLPPVNNWKLSIKRNWTLVSEFTANNATNVIADLTVPDVANNTSTTSSTMALSAAMWKELQDQINNLNSIWRFLSIWNAVTWLPQTNPTTLPYQYNAWDYYIVWTVDAWWTNYKPNGSQYTWVASTTVETATVWVWNMYVYDGTQWLLQLSWWQSFPIDNVLSTTSTNAVENRVVTNALLNKADISALPTTATSSTEWLVKLWSDTAQSVAANAVSSTADRTYAVQMNSADQLVVNVPRSDTNTTYNTATSSTEWLVKLASDTVQTEAAQTVSSTANRTYWVQLNANDQAVVNVPRENTTYSAWTNVQINGTTINATDTTYTAWANIQISNNNEISATDTTYSAWTWLSLNGTTFSNAWVTSVNSNTWAVTVNEFNPDNTGATWDVLTATNSWYERVTKQNSTTVTLSSSSWSSHTQTVTANWVTSSNTVIVSPAPSSMSDYMSWQVYCSAQWTDSLTFTCTTDPSNNLTVNIVILN